MNRIRILWFLTLAYFITDVDFSIRKQKIPCFLHQLFNNLIFWEQLQKSEFGVACLFNGRVLIFFFLNQASVKTLLLFRQHMEKTVTSFQNVIFRKVISFHRRSFFFFLTFPHQSRKTGFDFSFLKMNYQIYHRVFI